MRRIILLLSVMCMFLHIAEAAICSSSDSLEVKPQGRFFFSFDSRHSWLFNTRAKFIGMKMGSEISGKRRIGGGIYFVSSHVAKGNVIMVVDTTYVKAGRDSFPVQVFDTVNILTNFSYLSFFYEWVLLHKKRWEISLPLHTGLGTSVLYYHNEPKKKTVELSKLSHLLVMEVSGMVDYRFLKWASWGMGVGYRYIPVRDKYIRDVYNAPIYVFKLKILVGEIWRGMFPERKKH